MKLFRKILILLACIAMMILPLLQLVNAEEAFVINDYHVNIKTNEDGTFNVTETMSVTFDYPRHGLYFNIPTRYNMDFTLNGNNYYREYHFPVNNIKVLSNHNYETERYSSGVQIKIGDGDYYANTNETYIVSYTVHTKDLNLDGEQFIYYNLIGKWDTIIEKFSFDIETHKPIDKDKIEFYIGYDNNNINYLNYEVNDNKISGIYNQIISPNESFTFYLDVDNNYFSFKKHTFQYILIAIVSIIILIASYILFLKHGKDDELIIPVTINAPDNISSAECGYIIDGFIQNRDIISLIIEWGKKGYLKITDDDIDLTFSKLKDIDDSEPTYQRSMFNDLFKNGDETSSSKLSEKFYTSINDCKQNLNAYYHMKENKIFSTSSILFRVLTTILTLIPILIYTYLVHHYNYYSEDIFAIIIPIAILLIISIILLFVIESSRYSLNAPSLWALRALVIILISIAMTIFYFTTNAQDSCFICTIIIGLYTIIMALISQRMIKRTKRGTRLYGEVLGLKQFIQYTEEDRLKLLVDENPYVFYDILPYAYAFDLCNVWADHFKNLEIPPVDWYYTYGNYSSTRRMRRMIRSLENSQNDLVKTPPSTSNGGGSFGSSGGGGFSGGGFGGSSGGSW